ncbi:hypothetical protein DPMN_187972 [Dreissena polymorpha]|uniref:G-protein coupled receptors family 1 profile domain-containing protein n=1 Tax=Dreissena polymorpha TaxID=45954 RepID=A0A9D4DSK2_DREPO|nr:hypothetical protein DPMN_187972 [Dreissena polymorpha]
MVWDNETSNLGYVSWMTEVPLWIHNLELAYLLLIAGLGVPGNTLVIFVQSQNRVKTSTDILVITMAIVDLFGSSFNVTVYVFYQIPEIWTRIGNDFVCSLHKFCIYGTSLSSIFLLTVIALDRYMQTCRPLSSLDNTIKAKRACIGVAVVSVLLSIPALFVYHLNSSFECVRTGTRGLVMYIIDCLYALVFVGLFIVVSNCYLKIRIVLKRRLLNRISSKRGQNELTLNGFQTVKMGTWYWKLFGFFSNKVTPEVINVHSIAGSSKSLELTGKDSQARVQQTKNYEHETRKQDFANIHITRFGSDCSLNRDQTNSNLAIVDTSSDLRTVPRLNVAHGAMILKAPHEQIKLTATDEPTIEDRSLSGRTENSLEREEPKCAILTKEEQQLNRTTVIMSLITAVYIISWVINWVAMIFVTKETETGRIIIHMTKTSFMVNCVTNPALYIIMSSRFRTNAKKILCRC